MELRPWRTTFVAVLWVAFSASPPVYALVPPSDTKPAVRCPKLPACVGCGCRGGTGYRAPDDHCVGFRELAKVCGPVPTRVCKFENAPNTGRNKVCTKRRPKRHARAPQSPQS